MAKTITLIFLVIGLLLFPNSCTKEESYQEPFVEVALPTVNAVVDAPGVINLKFKVESANPIKYIRVNIDNEQQVPLFPPLFLYPESYSVEVDDEMYLTALQQNETEPFYFHIAVDDGVKLSHYYQPIKINPEELGYLGFFMITRLSVNRTKVAYYNASLQQSDFVNVDGEYVESETSATDDMLYVATHTPARLNAFEFEEQYLRWTKEPELPYPQFTDLYLSGNMLLSSTGSGRIITNRAATGMQQSITTPLADSVALKICANDDYIIGDFQARTGPGNNWVVFYKETGVQFQKYPGSSSVVDFYPKAKGDGFFIFGNAGGKSEFVVYEAEGNYISTRININHGTIGHTCRVDAETFLITIDRAIYRFNTMIQHPFKIFEFSEDIVDIAYDPAEEQLFVASSQKVDIFAFPVLQLIKSISSPNPLKAVEIRYGYTETLTEVEE